MAVSVLPALSGGLRKAALEWKYGMGRVSDDPVPLINYLDVSHYIAGYLIRELRQLQYNNFCMSICKLKSQ